jgi:hypothetical protein
MKRTNLVLWLRDVAEIGDLGWSSNLSEFTAISARFRLSE